MRKIVRKISGDVEENGRDNCRKFAKPGSSKAKIIFLIIEKKQFRFDGLVVTEKMKHEFFNLIRKVVSPDLCSSHSVASSDTNYSI